MTDDYQAQRIRGSIEIIDYAKSVAVGNNIIIDRFEWDDGQDIGNRDLHNFRVYAMGENRDIEIGDASLADYPGRVGTEETNQRVRDLILLFKDNSENNIADERENDE